MGIVTKNREWEHASLMAGKSMVFSTVLYGLAKSAIRRQRPKYTNAVTSFGTPFSNDGRFTSFPSGHTLTVTTVATAMAETFGEKHKWVPWVAYGIAGLTGVSRLYHNRHWASDVFAGGALGYFVTKTVFKSNRKQYKKRR